MNTKNPTVRILFPNFLSILDYWSCYSRTQPVYHCVGVDNIQSRPLSCSYSTVRYSVNLRSPWVIQIMQ